MIYKYCTTDGFDILLKARLKVARIENFNDPFELVVGVDEESAFNNIKKEYESNKNIINDWQCLLDDQKIEYDKNSIEDIIEKVTQFQRKDLKKSILSIRENWNEKIGIVCLSESSDIIQMWAHYADNHRGIVIALDENQFVKDRMALVKICCRNEMVLLPVTAIPEKLKQYEKYIDDAIRRKESNWVYEKEVRLYANLNERDKDGHYYSDKIVILDNGGWNEGETYHPKTLGKATDSQAQDIKIFIKYKPLPGMQRKGSYHYCPPQ